MRAAIVVAVALALAVGSTLAQAQSQPNTTLPPGQPAGLKQAQSGGSTLPIILGVGMVAGGIALAASGNDDNRNPVAVTTTTAP
jgi:hypothetical protein